VHSRQASNELTSTDKHLQKLRAREDHHITLANEYTVTQCTKGHDNGCSFQPLSGSPSSGLRNKSRPRQMIANNATGVSI
jgi:hypothetical protein